MSICYSERLAEEPDAGVQRRLARANDDDLAGLLFDARDLPCCNAALVVTAGGKFDSPAGQKALHELHVLGGQFIGTGDRTATPEAKDKPGA